MTLYKKPDGTIYLADLAIVPAGCVAAQGGKCAAVGCSNRAHVDQYNAALRARYSLCVTCDRKIRERTSSPKAAETAIPLVLMKVALIAAILAPLTRSRGLVVLCSAFLATLCFLWIMNTGKPRGR